MSKQLRDLRDEFTRLFNRQYSLIDPYQFDTTKIDRLLRKIESNRAILMQTGLYDEYKNAAKELIDRATQIQKALIEIDRNFQSSKKNLNQEQIKNLFLKLIGTVRMMSQDVADVISEYDILYRSIVPEVHMTTSSGQTIPALRSQYEDETIEYDDIPQKLLMEDRPIKTSSKNSSAAVDATVISRNEMSNMPIREIIAMLQTYGNHAILINELNDIESSATSQSREKRVDDALKRYGFGRKPMKITKKCEAMYGRQMTRDLYNYHRQIGGKMSISQFQKFLTNSFKKI